MNLVLQEIETMIIYANAWKWWSKSQCNDMRVKRKDWYLIGKTKRRRIHMKI